MELRLLLQRSTELLQHITPADSTELNELCIKLNKINKVVAAIEYNISKCKTTINVRASKPVKLPACVKNTINVSYPDEVINTRLYFVKSMGCYAIRINDKLIYGNVGLIGVNLPRTISCRDAINCTNSSCTYYHDPLTIPWSRDVRNYHPLAWQPTDQLENKKNRIMRHITNNIKNEVVLLSDEERGRWINQCMYDILVTLNIPA